MIATVGLGTPIAPWSDPRIGLKELNRDPIQESGWTIELAHPFSNLQQRRDLTHEL
jgi:hypothetical protein